MAKIKQKAFWIAAGDIIGRGFAFFTSIYLARTLGSEFYGLITVAVAILGYANWFADLGLLNIGTRETAKTPEKRIFRIQEILRTKVFLGFFVLVISIIVIGFVDLPKQEKQVIIGYLFSLVPYMSMLEWYFSGKQDFGKITLSKGLNGLIYFVLVVIFVHSSDQVTLVPVFYIIGLSVASLTLATFALRGNPFSLPSRGMQVYQDLLRTSSMLGIGQFFAQIVTLLPPILIGFIITLEDAGIYGAAFRVVIIAMMLDRVFVHLLLPNLSSIWTIDQNTAKSVVRKVFRFATVGGTLIGLCTALASEQIISILYGAEYADSALILKVLSIMIAVTFINSLFSFGLIATNQERKYFAATCIGGSISAVLLLTFTIFGNIFMTAIAVSASEVVITGFTYFWFKKTIPFNYFVPILVSYASALTVYILLSFVSFMPILNALIGALLFLFIIYQLKVITSDHLKWAIEKVTK